LGILLGARSPAPITQFSRPVLCCCGALPSLHEHTLAPRPHRRAPVSDRGNGRSHFISPARDMNNPGTEILDAATPIWSSACSGCGASGGNRRSGLNILICAAHSLRAGRPEKFSAQQIRRIFQPRKNGSATPAVPRRGKRDERMCYSIPGTPQTQRVRLRYENVAKYRRVFDRMRHKALSTFRFCRCTLGN